MKDTETDGVPIGTGNGEEPANAESPEQGAASDDANAGAVVEDSHASAAEECVEGDVEKSEPDPQALSEHIAELEQALEASRDQVLRGQAELENLRRRVQRDVEHAHKFGLERFVNEMLPVVDSMELALQAGGQDGATVDSILEGTELTLKMLTGALEKFDVVAIAAEHQAFDPELHQAMSMQSIEGVEPGTVVQVFQKGYSLAGRLVRPAMVVVSQ